LNVSLAGPLCGGEDRIVAANPGSWRERCRPTLGDATQDRTRMPDEKTDSPRHPIIVSSQNGPWWPLIRADACGVAQQCRSTIAIRHRLRATANNTPENEKARRRIAATPDPVAGQGMA
jgi:hypothetical protein